MIREDATSGSVVLPQVFAASGVSSPPGRRKLRAPFSSRLTTQERSCWSRQRAKRLWLRTSSFVYSTTCGSRDTSARRETTCVRHAAHRKAPRRPRPSPVDEQPEPACEGRQHGYAGRAARDGTLPAVCASRGTRSSMDRTASEPDMAKCNINQQPCLGATSAAQRKSRAYTRLQRVACSATQRLEATAQIGTY